jgi:uroporphyrinogen III methyltransferase/synthase
VPQEEINALLVRLAREGHQVVRLKGGDPYVFGRGGEEAEVLAEEGIPYEVVPGVTSGVAAAAWMGVPVTHRREAVRLTLITAHEALKSGGPQVRWDLLAKDPHSTIVGYMGVTALPRVVERLTGAGMDPETPAAMVEQGTTASQRQVVTTLAGLCRAVVDAGIKPPALFIIGPTVRHAERLDWFSTMPLAGQRLVLPGCGGSLGRALERAGADVVPLTIPVTPAARVVIAALPLSGCVVRSAAEVDAVHDERGGPGWEGVAVSWCVGRESADRATDCGWQDVVELDDGLDDAEVVLRIGAALAAGRHEGPGG